MTIRCDGRVGGSDGVLDLSDVFNTHWNVIDVLDDDASDVLRVASLSRNQAQIKLVVLREQAGRINEVRPIHRIQNFHDAHLRSEHSRRVHHDVKLRLLPSLHQNARNTAKPIQSRLDVVGGELPELRLWNFVGRQTVANDGKT